MATKEFDQTFTRGGGTAMVCDFCGREHVALLSPSLDDDDISHLTQLAEKNPDYYVLEADYNAIEYGEIGSIMFIPGCPCKGADKYEEFIWHERERIMTYIDARSTRELTESLSTHKQVRESIIRNKKAAAVADQLEQAKQTLHEAQSYKRY